MNFFLRIAGNSNNRPILGNDGDGLGRDSVECAVNR